MTNIPTRPPESVPPPGVRAKQANPQLDRLLETVLVARRDMQAELGAHPVVPNREMLVRRRLLRSLEAYVLALTAYGLPAPPRLRDELALQRSLVSTR